MKRLYIWGAGKNSKLVYSTINKDLCTVQGIIDSDIKKQGCNWINKFVICAPEVLWKEEFDYILISVKLYDEILQECLDMGISSEKVIPFWKPDEYMPYIDRRKSFFELEKELDLYRQRLHNMPYELGTREIPTVKSAISLLEESIKRGLSVCRFGDGELELMCGKERPWFQKGSSELTKRLREVFSSRKSNVIIALANNFGNLDCYTEDAAEEIRRYLYGDTRDDIMKYIDMSYTYYDAYVSRPYIIYKDKEHAADVFRMLRRLWKNRSLLVVEGKNTRMGAGNDLFSDAMSVRRIICPEVNAFGRYKEIFDSVCRNVKYNDMVLISLGPTATVMAYDIAEKGIQAFDIGQIDIEYEWFLRRVDERVEIAGKSVAEIDECHYPRTVVKDLEYESQIIDRITD